MTASNIGIPRRSGCSVSCEACAGPARNFIDAAASLLSTGLQRIDSEGRLAYLAQFDALTGLPNRALLADRFAQMIPQARRHGAPLGVLFIDLDEFKLVNDSLGHAGGDALLKEVAARDMGQLMQQQPFELTGREACAELPGNDDRGPENS